MFSLASCKRCLHSSNATTNNQYIHRVHFSASCKNRCLDTYLYILLNDLQEFFSSRLFN
ncbi:hypothetical protein ACIQD3_03215 [Peribacillus loiseleuriae]|uniref:hypothetical protein n=1 Tax=Peribacillus loiseleuriae TaxID=1679170 RepID=UPI003827589F